MTLRVTGFEPSLSSRCHCYWSSSLHLPGEYLLVLLLPIPSSTLTALSSLGSMNSPYLKSFWDCGRCFWGHHHIHSPHLLFLGSCTRGFHAHDLDPHQLCSIASLYFYVSGLPPKFGNCIIPHAGAARSVGQFTLLGATIKQWGRKCSGCLTQPASCPLEVGSSEGLL